jgi:prophage regulatory protein
MMPERIVNPKLLRLPRVKESVALSRTSIYRLISLGQFPKPINLGARAVAWLESDIDSWIQSKVDAAFAQSSETAK